MQNSAKKLVEKPEDAVKLEKRLDDLVENGPLSSKQADDVIEELRRVAEEASSKKFITKGKHLDDFGKLKAVSKYEEKSIKWIEIK